MNSKEGWREQKDRFRTGRSLHRYWARRTCRRPWNDKAKENEEMDSADISIVKGPAVRDIPRSQLVEEIRTLLADDSTWYADEIADRLNVDVQPVIYALLELKQAGEVE